MYRQTDRQTDSKSKSKRKRKRRRGGGGGGGGGGEKEKEKEKDKDKEKDKNINLLPRQERFHFLCACFPTEHSRYLHAHLDSSLSELNPDKDLDGRLRDHWVKNLPFNIQVCI